MFSRVKCNIMKKEQRMNTRGGAGGQGEASGRVTVR